MTVSRCFQQDYGTDYSQRRQRSDDVLDVCDRRPDGRNAPIMPPVVNTLFPTASVDIAGLTQESEFFDGEGDVISRADCGFDSEESGGGISECHVVQGKTLSSLTSHSKRQH